MLWCKEKYHVYITRNTYRGMLLEAGRHPGKESIIQMPGIRIGNDFYFDVVADSGINATYMPTMCEKDHMYADHLATRISEYYDFSNGQLTVSQVHRHPDGCLRFSQGDYPANIKLARQFGGVVNGLIFIDPKFRIKFWYIDENGVETEAEYEINDRAVWAAMPRINLTRLRETVERNEAKCAGFRKKEYRHERPGETKGFIRSKLSGLLKSHLEEEEHMYSKVERAQQTVMLQEETTANSAGFVDNTGEEDTSAESFIDFEKMQEALRPYTILMPEEYRKERYEGELMGYYHPETKTYNITPQKLQNVRTDAAILGVASRKERLESGTDNISDQSDLSVVWNDDQAEISIRDNETAEIHIDYYSCQQDIFSRNQGIIEKDSMAVRQAIISGIGSGGFKVGLELVRAGIGSLIVADNDILPHTHRYNMPFRHLVYNKKFPPYLP